jgi:regulatory protein
VPLKNTGKTIKSIKKKSKTVLITFLDETNITLHIDTLEMFPLYVGKILLKEDIEEIISFSNKAILMQYALDLLKACHYSENRMKRKLSNKIDDTSSINYTIKKLKEYDLINDLALIEEYCCYYDELKYGQNKIIAKLYEHELKEKDISKISFPISLEKEKAVSLLDSLSKKYDKFPLSMKKKKIYSALLSKGFISNVAKEAIKELETSNNENELDYQKLLLELEKQYIKYSYKYTSRTLKDKVFVSLMNKGYKIQNIIKAWGENYD